MWNFLLPWNTVDLAWQAVIVDDINRDTESHLEFKFATDVGGVLNEL